MNPYVILTDVTSDLSPELREYFGVTDYVHGYVHFSSGKDLKTTLDWDGISREEFYSRLSDKKEKITTAPASPEEYYEIFRSYAQKGVDILSISISSKISSTYSVAARAAERVGEEYPACRIVCVDSLRMSGALGLLSAYAHELKSQGKTMDEVVAWLEKSKNRLHQMGPIDDLMFVARRGRISTGKAIMGSFAGVKPMGDCNGDGYVTVLTKVKGIKKALSATVAYIRRAATEPREQYVFIMHSNREAYALQLKEMIKAQIGPKKVFVSDVFSASGTNIGPGMVCAYFLGAPLSADGNAEKEIMNLALSDIQ